MSADQNQDSVQQTRIPTTIADLIGRLDWRSELLTVAVVLAEVFLVWLAFGLVMAETVSREAYPFWIVAFVLLGAHYVVHLLDQARVWSPDYEIVMVAAIVLTLLVSIKAASFPGYAIYDVDWLVEAANGLAFFDADQSRPIWGNVVLVGYGWFRARSREEPSLDSAYTMLRWGTIALGIILIMIQIGAPEDLEVHDILSLGTLGFFGSVLAAIGLGRMRLEGFRAATPLGPRWLASFATPILVIFLIAIVGAGIFSRRFFETVVWMLSPVFFVLGVVFQIIVLAIAILAFIILTPIFWLIGDLESEPTNATATPAGDQSQPNLPESSPETFTIPEPLQYLIAAIVLVAIISLLTRYLFRRRSRNRPESIEERESVMDWGDIVGSLGDRLKSMFARGDGEDPYADLRGDDRWQHTIRVRQRYRDLQNRGEELGRARHTRETAEDYRPVVGARFEPQARPVIDAMTMTYRRIRYSGIPASEQDAEEMDRGWDDVRDAAADDQSQ